MSNKYKAPHDCECFDCNEARRNVVQRGNGAVASAGFIGFVVGVALAGFITILVSAPHYGPNGVFP